MIATFRSLMTPDALAECVTRWYGLRVDSCVLLRSLSNDVYEVTTSDRRFALKLYGAAGWSAEEVVWEQELAAHVASVGVEVAAVVPLADGRLAGELDAAEGIRPFALTEFVDGEKPQPPFDDVLYHDFGALTARFHRAADGFASPRRRRPFDLERTLHEPLRLVLPHLADNPADHELVRELGAEADRRVGDLVARGLEWGIRHGDVTLDNVHRTERGLVLHDLDLAGPGWRAADLTGVAATPHWDAFQTGYQQVRPLADVEKEAISWLGVIERIANLAFHLIDKPAFRGTESLGDGWVERELTALQEVAQGG